MLKVLTGFGIRRQDPALSFRFNLGRYSGQLGNIQAAFTNDILDAGKLQNDARLISRGLAPITVAKEFEKQQSNKYRVMSEIYKDVKALRTIGFSEKEIKDLMKGRRAVSKKDISSVMSGLFEPDNIPKFQKGSGMRRVVDQINRELEKNYKPNDFYNKDVLRSIRSKYKNIPLGLSDEDREKYLRTAPETKIEDIKIPALEERLKLREDQQSSLIEQTPAAPSIPMPTNIVTSMAQINPQSGLTRTQEALLSPDEKVIASKRNQGIMGLV